ncbi:tetratricopeptide repeat protein [Synechococcus elongatus]|uniref:O-linked N-acetylglucosamine transferase, SPINDLY family protein n=1 Tax=Synechococcus elongatus TaxID=32046 RepID=UPI000F7EA7EA|nr:tetratricopeptide repeat protein [Synechococcus elongatus]
MTNQESYQKAIEQWSLGEYLKAIHYFKQAVRTKPDDDHYWYALGGAYHTQKKYRGARFCFEKSLAINPNQEELVYLLCEINYLLGDHKSVRKYSQLVDLSKSKNIEISYKIALSFKELGEFDRAGEICAEIIEANDDFWKAKLLAAELLKMQGFVGEVRPLLLETLNQYPDLWKAWNELANCEMSLGNDEEALFAFSQAEKCAPDTEKAVFGSNYLFEFSSGNRTPQAILQAHESWSEKYSAKNTNFSYKQKSENHKIHVAYLSADFRTHSVSHFIHGILESHSRENFFITLLSNTEEDSRTKTFKELCDKWIDLKKINDDEAIHMLRDLNIDLLVELSGHTGRNKLPLISNRIAPVQISYIGYFATTGLTEMDYWITDSVIHPQNTKELSTEVIARLSRCYLAYVPPLASPHVSAAPVIDNQYITFGSFVDSRKISDYSIMLWSEILQRVPNSKILIKNKSCRSPIYCSEILEKFVLCQIHKDRILFSRAQALQVDHLSMYGNIDIALDTYPASGCTTTAEALWMGVPVLTRLGDLMVSRNSASLLHALNLQDWIAETDEEYVEKGVQFAKSIDQLILLRQGMRERFIQSELYDSQDLTKHLEAFYLHALQEKTGQHIEIKL